jgi:hypothetical protein
MTPKDKERYALILTKYALIVVAIVGALVFGILLFALRSLGCG